MQLPETAFFRPRPAVSIVDLGDTTEAVAIRSLLEAMGAIVLLHQPGTPEDFLTILGQADPPAKTLILCAHGTEKGLHFGEYAPFINASMLDEGYMPPKVIAEHLGGCWDLIVSTACDSGAEEMAKAFTNKGPRTFIAPLDQPEAADALLLVHSLLHGVFANRLKPLEAFDRIQHAALGRWMARETSGSATV